MEVDDSIQTQVSKFQRICCNDDKDNIDNSSNPSNKIGIITNKLSTYEAERWPSSRIVRVSRASGGKDRHSKVLTSKGLRDRRVRLSVTTAIQFYDLQDRLGYDQPSKAVEWLIKAAASSIAELPSLDQSSFVHFNNNNNNVVVDDEKKVVGDVDDEVVLSKSYSSSASEETSKGSGGLCLSRSENRIRARERARGLAAAKKEKENNNNNGGVSQTTSSFTDLLTSGGIRNNNNNNNNNNTSTPMDYFQMEQQFGNNCSQSQQQPQPHFSFLQENLSYGTSSGYNNNNNNRGTLQSNLMSNLPHHHHHHLLQRFQQPMVDGSTSTNSPFFIAPNMGGSGSSNQFLATGLDSQRLRLYGGDGGGQYYDHHKDKSKS